MISDPAFSEFVRDFGDDSIQECKDLVLAAIKVVDQKQITSIDVCVGPVLGFEIAPRLHQQNPSSWGIIFAVEAKRKVQPYSFAYREDGSSLQILQASGTATFETLKAEIVQIRIEDKDIRNIKEWHTKFLEGWDAATRRYESVEQLHCFVTCQLQVSAQYYTSVVSAAQKKVDEAEKKLEKVEKERIAAVANVALCEAKVRAVAEEKFLERRADYEKKIEDLSKMLQESRDECAYLRSRYGMTASDPRRGW